MLWIASKKARDEIVKPALTEKVSAGFLDEKLV